MISELPPNWEQVPLSSITTDAHQRIPLINETIRYIDIGSIDRSSKSITSPQELLGKDAPSRARKQVAAGDTLVSMTRPSLNAVALVPKSSMEKLPQRVLMFCAHWPALTRVG